MSSASTHICIVPSRYNFAYSSGSSMAIWQVRLMNRLIRVLFLNPSQLPNSQYGAYSQHWYIHQCCCVVACILQILFSSYHISLSSNQSFVTKIRSISISSPCRFHFMLYCFRGLFWSPLPLFVPLRSVQSGHPPDVLHPCFCPYQSS